MIHNLICVVNKNEGVPYCCQRMGGGIRATFFCDAPTSLARKIAAAESEGWADRKRSVEKINARPARVLGREAAHPCVSKEAKLAKIVFLIVKDFCARPLKDLSIFAGFVRREAASH
jgi:hypothetical protein